MLEDTIKKLFKDAESNGGIEYVYTLQTATSPSSFPILGVLAKISLIA